jgi:hypothetical protein
MSGAQSSSLVNNDSLSDPAKNEFLVPPESSSEKANSSAEQELVCSQQEPFSGRPSIEVDRPTVVRPPRTAAAWGITGQELNRLCNAVRFMELHCERGPVGLWLATTARATPRDLIAAIWKRITRLQGMHRLRCYSVITFESRGGLHAHITLLGTRDIAKRLKQSTRFGELLDIRPVTDPDGLTRRYLAKERTPQAGYGREYILGGRIRGSHRLAGGGDRVRLSRELERDAIEAGYVEAWQHSNARRSAEEKHYRPRPCCLRRERSHRRGCQ